MLAGRVVETRIKILTNLEERGKMAIIKNKSVRVAITSEIRKYFDSISDLLIGREGLIKKEKEIFTREVINELEYIRRNVYEIFLYCGSDDRYENSNDKEELRVWFKIIKETHEKIKEVISVTGQKELICAIILHGTEKLAGSSRANEIDNFHTQFTIAEKRKKKSVKSETVEEKEESAIARYVNLLDYEFLRMNKMDIIHAAFPEFKIELMSTVWQGDGIEGNKRIIENLISRMYDAPTYSSLLDSILLLIQSEVSIIFKNPNVDFSLIYSAEEPEVAVATEQDEEGEDDSSVESVAPETEVGTEVSPEEQTEEQEGLDGGGDYEGGLGLKRSKQNAVPDDVMIGLLTNYEFGSGLIRDNEDITLEGNQFKLYDKYINYLRDNFFKSGEKNG